MSKDIPDLKVLKRQLRQQTAYGTLILFLVVLLGFIGASLAYLQDVLPVLPVFLTNTLCIYMGFTVLHEASHGNIRGKGKSWRRIETGIGWISGFLLTIPFSVFRHLHLTHHAHTNHPKKDPDYWVASGRWWMIGLKSASIIVGYYWHFAHFYPREPNPREKKYVRQSLMGFGLVYLVTFACILSNKGWEVFFLWWGPALSASGFLAFGFNWLPHHPHKHQDRYKHTRIFLWPALTPLLLVQNYHLIHHLHPGLPFYTYPKVFKLLRAEIEAKGSTIIGKKAPI